MVVSYVKGFTFALAIGKTLIVFREVVEVH